MFRKFAVALLATVFLSILALAVFQAMLQRQSITRAEQGNSSAQFNLGVKADGQGVLLNSAEAIRLSMLTAEQGDKVAQNNLGAMYALGAGVPQSYTKAYVWLSVSVEQGFPKANVNRDMVAAYLTAPELSNAQALTTRCIESNYKDCD
jgi:TPR repeat protein